MMPLIEKQKALSLIEKSKNEVEVLVNKVFLDISDCTTCVRNLRIRIDAVFGKESPQSGELLSYINTLYDTKNYTKALYEILSLLVSFETEISELWSDGVRDFPDESKANLKVIPKSNTEVGKGVVFLVHGHDHGRLQTIARFIERLGLFPVVLHEKPNEGRTLIEKIERNDNVNFAVILLTPDDHGALINSNKLNYRARQNVILELGYFLAKLGRNRVCALRVPDVEIPSDYSGVLYIEMNDSDTWKLELAKELKSSGLNVDLNRVL